ncbi:hypothetical protein BY996DRAFT_6409860 [Phakopsora pachyrhizi]|nr:hypothetical protein BY996DRAFT_6409860 [Phakopsora pachyrhizi]
MSPRDCKLQTSCFAVARFVLAPATPKADPEIARCLHIPTPTNNTAPCPPVELWDFTSMSDNWKDGTNGFTEVHQYKNPFFLEGRKVWCNPCIKAYGYEHPIPEVPTSDYNSGIILTLPSGKTQLLKTAGVPTDEIPITTNDEILGIRIRQREADCDVVEDVDKMLPRAHIRGVQQA